MESNKVGFYARHACQIQPKAVTLAKENNQNLIPID